MILSSFGNSVHNFSEKSAYALAIKAVLASDTAAKKEVQTECPKDTDAPCTLAILKGARPLQLTPEAKKR